MIVSAVPIYMLRGVRLESLFLRSSSPARCSVERPAGRKLENGAKNCPSTILITISTLIIITKVAVTGGADATVRVWDARTGGGVRSLVVKGKEVLCVRPWPRDPDR